MGYPRAIGAVSVINHFYGRDDIRLGAFKGDFGASSSGMIIDKQFDFKLKQTWFYSGPYIDHLLDLFESPIRNYSQVEDAVTVLRRSLADAEAIINLWFVEN